VTAADPTPIAPDPHIARCRRDADDFDSRRRRRHHYHAAHIVTLVWNDHAPGKRHADDEAEG
jgi:hypothetical protein